MPPLQVVLASASPRRRELLERIFPEFEVFPSNVDESRRDHEGLEALTQRLALLKARSAAARFPEKLVIGSDTLVGIEEAGTELVFGQPTSEHDARATLSTLSGRRHSVVTSVALVGPKGERVFSERSQVTFKSLSEEEIAAYVATGEPMGKAGAYAIQGAAKAFVQEVKGSVSNVIGLPLERLKQELDDFLRRGVL